MIFELRMKNVSGHAIAFPWSTDTASVRPFMRGARVLTISLELGHPAMNRETIGIQSVYGAEDVPGSLRMINPGEMIEIRGSALVRGFGDLPTEPWARNVKVTAGLSLAGRDQHFELGRSQNMIVVQLRSK